MRNRFKEADYFIENGDYSVEEIDTEEITILNWNIQKKNRTDHWTKDFKQLLEDYAPHIIQLQECQFQKGLEKLLHAEHYGFIFAPNFVDILKNLHSGVLSASYSRHKQSTIIKSYAFEPLIKVPKIFLSSTYSISNRNDELLLLNIHAINFVGFWKFISQVQQLEYAIKTHSGPIILSGDFNTWNKRRTSILDKILMNAGLSKIEFDNDHKKNIKKFFWSDSLDHIYYRGLSPSTTHVLKTKTSDHNPLIVKFKLI